MTRGGPRPGSGRPPGDVQRDRKMMLRLSADEEQAIKDAAGVVRPSTWAREAVLKAAKRRGG